MKVQFILDPILLHLQARHPDVQIVNIKDISSAQSPSITGASVLFSFPNNGEQYLIGLDIITGGRGVWYVLASGASAPKSEFHYVSNLAQMVLVSPKISKDWAIAEIQGEEARTNIV